jgi:hypothetical protein
LALRVGFRGLFREFVVAYVGLCLDLSGTRRGLAVGLLELCWRERIVGACIGGLFPCALNNQTVQGEPIKLSIRAGKLTLNGTSNVIVADVKATNGVIHAIDTVIVPPSVS